MAIQKRSSSLRIYPFASLTRRSLPLTGGTLVFIAGMTSRSERTLRRFIRVTCAPNCARCAKTHFVVRFPVSFLVAALPR
jgi:hypothetical protein